MSFKDFFMEGGVPPMLSSTRLNTFIIISVACLIGLVAAYIGLYLTWFPVVVAGIPIAPSTMIIDSLTWLVSGMLAFAVGSKVWQKKYENGKKEFAKDTEPKEDK